MSNKRSEDERAFREYLHAPFSDGEKGLMLATLESVLNVFDKPPCDDDDRDTLTMEQAYMQLGWLAALRYRDSQRSAIDVQRMLMRLAHNWPHRLDLGCMASVMSSLRQQIDKCTCGIDPDGALRRLIETRSEGEK